jgi:hypothetical protein
MGIPMPFGALVFWYFVVPIVQRIREHVGCRYLFLFAADLTKNEKLVKYYADQLNFQIPENLATAKPIYDFSCKFMCQDINGLLSFFTLLQIAPKNPPKKLFANLSKNINFVPPQTLENYGKGI